MGDSQSDLPPSTYPRLIILKRADNLDVMKASTSFRKLLRNELEQRRDLLTKRVEGPLTRDKLDNIINSQFVKLEVVGLPSAEAPQLAWKKTRDYIIHTSNEAYAARIQEMVTFLVNYFKAFFHLACEHFCQNIVTRFSFIRASRLQNPVSPDISKNIAILMRHVDRFQINQFVVPTIASALALDSFPPEMHRRAFSFIFRLLVMLYSF
jgi:hypothetical protein